jgi:hypothetical protein
LGNIRYTGPPILARALRAPPDFGVKTEPSKTARPFSNSCPSGKTVEGLLFSTAAAAATIKFVAAGVVKSISGQERVEANHRRHREHGGGIETYRTASVSLAGARRRENN